MKMTEDEIIRDYLEAKDKKKQVEILADMNLCTKKEMAQWLADHGQQVDKRLLAGDPRKRKEEPVIIPDEPELTDEQEEKFARILDSVDEGRRLPARKPLPDQTAKADAGKLQLSLVPPELIKACAELEAYDQASLKMVRAKMICKTRKVGHEWKGLFECPFCGKEFEAYVNNVLRGRQRSCGCAKGKLAIASKGTHGDTKTRLYRIYRHILERCESPSCKEFKWYGARGIECEFKDYEDFREFALANGYNDDLTVERIDVNGNYSRENVTFIPLRLQARNTRNNVMITYKGLTLCAAEWANMLGMRPDTLTKRIRSGWSAERALETTVNGSIDVSLIPPMAIKAIRAIRLYGIKKYKNPDNWKSVEPQRYRDAMYRHFLAYLEDNEGLDEESGYPHLWHCLCNAAFLCAMEFPATGTTIDPEIDDGR